jgi:hypothetical protein
MTTGEADRGESSSEPEVSPRSTYGLCRKIYVVRHTLELSTKGF